MEGLVHRCLRAFVALAEQGTLAAAGGNLGRTPSAVSLQISALEQRIGRRLFTRGARGLVLAPAGQVLLDHARQMLALDAAAQAAVRGVAVQGDVAFGMPQDFATSRLADTLQRFRRMHAGVKVRAVIERNNVVARQVKERQLDLALLIGRRRHALAVEIAFTTGSVPAMWAAVQAGTGVTARMDLGAPREVADAGRRLGLPALPSTQLSLVKCQPRMLDVVEALAEEVRASLDAAAAPAPRRRGRVPEVPAGPAAG
jgi:DNA-binding transcriptional LysR family regulator